MAEAQNLRVEQVPRHAIMGMIGANEIQRNVIARRGQPR
jgi:hypothetical protein